MKRRRYDDDFRAAAVLMLEAAGYPDREGALSQVAGRLNLSRSTLRSWFTGEHNPPPVNIHHEKRFDLIQAIRDELASIFPALGGKRDEATYRELVTAVGILTDKLQLLTGQPTWRGEIIDLLRQGAVTPADVETELGHELARELFDAAGVDRSAG